MNNTLTPSGHIGIIAVILLVLLTTVATSPNPVDGQAILTWEKINPAGNVLPGARYMPLHDVRNNVWTIMGGEEHINGQPATVLWQDIWDFDFATHKWTNRTNDNLLPPGTWRPGRYDSNGHFITWGGKYAPTDTVYRLRHNDSKWDQENASFPSSKAELSGYNMLIYKHPATKKDYIYVFAGSDHYEINETRNGLTFKRLLGSDDSWEQIPVDEASVPPGRYFSSAVYREADNSWYIFGGTRNVYTGDHLNDLWRFKLDDETWEEIKTTCRPPQRALHTATVSSNGMGMFLFGGLQEGTGVEDLWMFHFESQTWARIDSHGWEDSGHRYGHAMQMSTDKNGEEWIYVFGGFDIKTNTLYALGESRQHNDMWRLSIENLRCSPESLDDCANLNYRCDQPQSLNANIEWEDLIFLSPILFLVLAVSAYFFQKGKAAQAAAAINEMDIEENPPPLNETDLVESDGFEPVKL